MFYRVLPPAVCTNGPLALQVFHEVFGLTDYRRASVHMPGLAPGAGPHVHAIRSHLSNTMWNVSHDIPPTLGYEWGSTMGNVPRNKTGPRPDTYS